jgi:hypothetical protein
LPDLTACPTTVSSGATDMMMESLLTIERIKEVEMMCARDEPMYEQISNFSVALYVLGCSDSQDLMSIHNFDDLDAADFLRTYFKEISKIELDASYNISRNRDKYLMVLGDPSFPKHFAVIVDMESKRPFFSKLRYFGAGYDSLEDLVNEYSDDGVDGYEDIHYFKLL